MREPSKRTLGLGGGRLDFSSQLSIEPSPTGFLTLLNRAFIVKITKLFRL